MYLFRGINWDINLCLENFFSSAYCTDNFAFKTMINCPRLLKGCKLQSSAEKKIQIKNYSVQIKKKKLRFFYTNYEMCSTISLQCNSFYQSYSKKNPFYKIFRELNQQIWRKCILIEELFFFLSMEYAVLLAKIVACKWVVLNLWLP